MTGARSLREPVYLQFSIIGDICIMYPRVDYEMTEAQLKAILEACKRVPAMMIGGFAPSSPQENANRAWATLGKEMGFDPMTVQPIAGKGNRFFSAVPSETEDQRKDRVAQEKIAADLARIQKIDQQIADLEREKAAIQSGGYYPS